MVTGTTATRGISFLLFDGYCVKVLHTSLGPTSHKSFQFECEYHVVLWQLLGPFNCCQHMSPSNMSPMSLRSYRLSF